MHTLAVPSSCIAMRACSLCAPGVFCLPQLAGQESIFGGEYQAQVLVQIIHDVHVKAGTCTRACLCLMSRAASAATSSRQYSACQRGLHVIAALIQILLYSAPQLIISQHNSDLKGYNPTWATGPPSLAIQCPRAASSASLNPKYIVRLHRDSSNVLWPRHKSSIP